MKTYTSGARLFCDFHFGGKPKAICVSVLEPGRGNVSEGKIKVRLTQEVGAYRRGEELILNSVQAVPVEQEFKKAGSCFRWVNTNYQWL